MTPFGSLWLPILLSAVAVFLVSSVIHMMSPWHKSDYPRIPNEDAFRAAVGPMAIPPGDYNKNGVVDAADSVLWRKGDPAADSNGDTFVDQVDYDLWLANFGNGARGSGAALSSASVPEPAALTLLAIGLFAMCAGRRGNQLRTRTI